MTRSADLEPTGLEPTRDPDQVAPVDADSALRATIVIMAKAPEPGKVKTRLGPVYSSHQSAALAAAALLDTLDVVAEASGEDHLFTMPVVALTGDLDQAAAAEALRSRLNQFRVIEQRGSRFGDRLVAAHRDAAGPFGVSVQIGMDTPQVRPDQLRRAAESVLADDGPDAVLGMAVDGGWWLLALRRAGDARLIAGVPMSNPETGRLTCEALEAGGLRVGEIEALRDVDYPEDVIDVARTAPKTRFAQLHQVLMPSRPAGAGVEEQTKPAVDELEPGDLDVGRALR